VALGACALVAVTVAVVVAVHVLAPGTSYRSSIAQLSPDGDGDVVVTVAVTNDSAAAATPTCEVTVSSPAQLYTGTAAATAPRTLGPGQSATYDVLVPVGGGGSDRVDERDSSVACT